MPAVRIQAVLTYRNTSLKPLAYWFAFGGIRVGAAELSTVCLQSIMNCAEYAPKGPDLVLN